MADSFSKKEREKKRRKKKQEKAEKKIQRKSSESSTENFMYLDENGNLTPTPPDKTKRVEIKLEDIAISTPKMADMEEEDPIKKGIVKFYNEEKRFGFIKEDLTGADFFVHEENLIDRIGERDKVEFEIGTGPKGLVAVNVKLFKEKPKAEPKKEEVKSETGKEEVKSEPGKEEVKSETGKEEVKSETGKEEVKSETGKEEVKSEPKKEE